MLDGLIVPQLSTTTSRLNRQSHIDNVAVEKMLIPAAMSITKHVFIHLQAGSDVACTGLRQHKGRSASCCARTSAIPPEKSETAHEPKSLWKNTKGLSQQLRSRHTLIPQPIFSSQHLFHGFTLHDSCAVDQNQL